MDNEFKYIVRLSGRDLPGGRKVIQGLTGIKGIGHSMANAIVKKSDIDPDLRVGFLTDEQINHLSDLIQDFNSMNLPDWALNRRLTVEAGNTSHMVTSDLDFTIRNNIEDEKKLRSWRGIRHTYGLKVRGQRTRTTTRKGRSIGVKKALLQAKKS